MKRLLYITIALLALASLSSCQKKDEEEKIPFPVGNSYYNYSLDLYFVMHFTSENTVTYESRTESVTGNLVGDPNHYTYVLNYPTLTIYKEDGTQFKGGTFEFVDDDDIKENTWYGTVEYWSKF
ncbi:MAG: hypothetical protein LKK19_00925 [Bacteroidales bacterium]|jgi:hypothetical protein|nr:hypothetical protein [Bacteroidales bacterium]MCI2121249.1 hypothetical protein [Bacteroidales bacterium]MCI2146155.1 hypothetical protein [Bacteroidales bacterium]